MTDRSSTNRRRPTTLGIVLGDQLDLRGPEAMGLDRERDVLLMMEVAAASTAPASHVQRTVLFLSAMRHHAAALREAGWSVEYTSLADPENTHSFAGEIARAITALRPSSVACLEPGSFPVQDEVESACAGEGVPLRMHEDPRVLCSRARFEAWASGRKTLTLEHFYRAERRRLGILMTDDGDPVGGAWNFDKANRGRFKSAPTAPPVPVVEPDAVTRAVIRDVNAVLPDLPGRIDRFDWPVTRDQALDALRAFIDERLPHFGDFQDAMWVGEDTLYHALLAPALNLGLLDPREVCAEAEQAYVAGRAPINAVEGFIRQIIGWREFIRGVYWREGREYERRNALDHHGDLPPFYWTGETDMVCLGDAVRSVLDRAYGHHIARLMLLGNFSLLAGVEPRQVNDWFLGMYADAVDWVTVPNTIGMALHADGGVVATKPYAASGRYVQRMSNACSSCRYDPGRRHGESACPITVLYWDFLMRHESRLRRNHRMAMVLKNLDRLDEEERVAITVSARSVRRAVGVES